MPDLISDENFWKSIKIAQDIEREGCGPYEYHARFLRKHGRLIPPDVSAYIDIYFELKEGRRLSSKPKVSNLRKLLEVFSEMGPQQLFLALRSLQTSFEPHGKKLRLEARMSPWRALWREFHGRLAEQTSFPESSVSFEAQVSRAGDRSPAARAKRLAAAPIKPKVVMRLVQDFERNPDVVAEVLYRAQGCCEDCGNPAPFKRRSDGSPYLEVHHVVRLADGGEDTVDNAIALCPNCHRRRHFGTDEDEQHEPLR